MSNRQTSRDPRPWNLLLLSAETASALESATDSLVEFLRQHPDEDLAEIARRSQSESHNGAHRRMLVCHETEDALDALESRNPTRVLSSIGEARNRPVTFMFSGLGDHYVNMGLGLYRSESAFRRHVDACAELLRPHLSLDLRDVLYPTQERVDEFDQEPILPLSRPHPALDLRKMLYPGEERADRATQKLNQTFLTQPALFVIEYALAQLLMEWGIRPEAMIGYSIGEYVAACLAGVFSLEDALFLVAKRAQMIQELPNGSMLAVPLAEKDSYGLLGQALSLAAVNGPTLGVVSGPESAIAALEQQLVERGLACRRLQTSHAFHSKMMNPIARSFTELVESITLNSPQIPLVSNLTGIWMTPAQATDPSYWARHMCETVRFADGIEQLWAEPSRVLLEVGPGQTLCTLAMQHPKTPRTSDCTVLSSLRHSYDNQSDGAFLLNTLGELWLAGIPVNWSEFHSKEGRDLIPAQPDASARDSNQEGMSPLSPRSNLRNPYVAPGTEMEHKIAKIWEELLGIEQMGIHDNFFKVGGQSLQGIQLISRLRAAFKVDLPLQALFETPTVTGLALTIEEMLIAEIEQLSEDEAVRSA